MRSFSLQTATKVGFAGSIAYAIAQFFDFNTHFNASINAGMGALGGILASWFSLPQLTIVFSMTMILGVIESYLLGNNYIAIFINILFAGVLWRYLQFRGLLFGFFGVFIKLPSILIMSNSSDKITMAYDMICTFFIGLIVGLIINLLFPLSSSHEQLQKQLFSILDSSQQLCQKILEGYLSGNLDEVETQNLRLKIIKIHQDSQTLFKQSSFDITGHQLGQADWQSIVNTETNIILHLLAILHLVQTNKGINLPKELKEDFINVFQSLINCFSTLQVVIIKQNKVLTLEPLNQDFSQLHQTLLQEKNNQLLRKIPTAEILCFYSIIHRLQKLISELSYWESSSF